MRYFADLNNPEQMLRLKKNASEFDDDPILLSDSGLVLCSSRPGTGPNRKLKRPKLGSGFHWLNVGEQKIRIPGVRELRFNGSGRFYLESNVRIGVREPGVKFAHLYPEREIRGFRSCRVKFNGSDFELGYDSPSNSLVVRPHAIARTTIALPKEVFRGMKGKIGPYERLGVDALIAKVRSHFPNEVLGQIEANGVWELI